jgi:alpha-L-rhamnosidase
MVANGATTIWELWNGNTADPKMNSQNHIMLLGDLIVWMYEDLGGIKTDPLYPGFKVIEMKPSFVSGLTHVDASYHSMHGWIRSNWTNKEDQFTWSITIPGNTKAMIYLPAKSEREVSEGGMPAVSAAGVRFIKWQDGLAEFEIGSGEYSFLVTK